MTDQTPDIATIGIKVDANGVNETFTSIDAGAAKMAASVQKSADQTGKAISAVGDGGEAAAQKVGVAGKSIVESVQRTTAALNAHGKGGAESLRPYVDGLDQAKVKQDAVIASQNAMGISAKQTAAALRGVPAQFTDIVTSLQGGQAPLTVFLQQGGQLKDMFGGAGPAAKALGGYVAGLVNPFTLAAVAVGGLTYAYYRGSQEADAYAKALILTGNAAGTTVGQLSDMAKRISGVVGTQGNAADALATFAGSAKVGAVNMEAFTQSAIRFERVTGQAVGDTAKQFADLAKDPLAASLKLNEGMNYLSESTYRQIKALEDQGRATEAANLAQKTFADTLSDRSGEMEKRLGSIERLWKGIKDAVSGAASAAAGFGRDGGLDEQIAKARQNLVYATRTGAGVETLPQVRSGGRTVNRRAEAEAELARLLEQKRVEEDMAAQRARSTAQVKARAEYDKEGVKYLGDRQKMEAEIARQTAMAATAGASPKEIADRQQAIRDSFKSKLVDKDAERALKDATRDLEKYRDLMDELAGKQAGLSKDFGENIALLYRGAKANGDPAEVRSQAIERLLAQQPFYIAAVRQQTDADKAWADARKKLYKEVEDQADAVVKAAQQSAKSAEERALGLRDEEEAMQRARALNIGLAQALEEVRIARLQDAIAQEQAKPDASQERIDALQKEIEARRDLAKLNEQKGRRDSANEDLKRFMKPDFSTDFSAGFDKSSQAAGTFVQTMAKLIDAQGRYNRVVKDSGSTNKQIKEAESGYLRQQISGYATLAGAAKGFFNEKSTGYKVLLAAEQGLRAAELAGSIASIGRTFAEGQAKALTGVANQASGDPYTAFPRMAAMAAIMAGLGFVVAGGQGAGSSEPAVPLNTGTGTVFGDSEAQSKSIANSIDLLKDVDTLTMRYSAQMLASLRNIESSLAGVTGQILRNGGSLTGLNFDATKTQNSSGLIKAIQTGATVTFPGLALIDKTLLGGIGQSIAGRLLGGLFGSTKTNLKDSGLQFFGTSLEKVLSGGLGAAGYQSIETTKKSLFGLSKSSSTNTNYLGLDAGLTNQFTNIIKDTYDSIIAANKALGFSVDETAAKISGFTVDLGRISLKDLSGEQIQERLTAVFGAFADNLAMASAAQYADFQKAGEGYFETLVRVASGYEEATAILDRLRVSAIGLGEVTRQQGDVAAELVRQSLQAKEGLSGISEVLGVIDDSASAIADAYTSLTGARLDLKLFGLDGEAVGLSLLKGSGGIDALADSLKAFEDGFVSDSDKITNQAERMSVQFKLLGLTLPSSSDAFVSLVKGIDTSTDAGKTLLGGVLGLSGGFSDLLGAIKDVGSGIEDEIERIKGLSSGGSAKTFAQLQSDFAIKTAQARSGEQAAIDVLPSISQALLKAAEATAGSSLDLALIQARTLASLQATLGTISDPTKRLGTIPGFAAGTSYFPGGLRIVGENGPELEATGASRIFDASQTARILKGGGGSPARDENLTKEVAGLREDQRIQAAAMVAMGQRIERLLNGVTQDGDAVRTVAA